MLSVPGSSKIFVASAPVDFRKSHDGLAAIVEQAIGREKGTVEKRPAL
ncbi:IS66 Orf2 like protein [Blastopirellula retiformator]|uniref:IS66 Orf2 like protein n=1 Tax=Blastopirellula retiformator TaxID=2527970 RepID=A0A5C5V7Q6_9BACT|nr:IS66 Orf2 like protein [Blastopirellula retiformator]